MAPVGDAAPDKVEGGRKKVPIAGGLGEEPQLLRLGWLLPSVIVLGELELLLWVWMEKLASISLAVEGKGKTPVLGKRRNYLESIYILQHGV